MRWRRAPTRRCGCGMTRSGSLKPIVTTMLLAAALPGQTLPDLVLCGGHSVDRGSGTVPALLAEHLDWPVLTDVIQFEIQSGLPRATAAGARGRGPRAKSALPAILGLETDLVHLVSFQPAQP